MMRLYKTMKSHDHHMQLSTSCSNQLLHSEKKMGGTMMLLDGRWAGRKLLQSSDAKGRWSSITLVGRCSRKVTLISAYRVCHQKGGVGSTIFHQQQIDFESEGQKNVDLRKCFCQDLTCTIRQLHSDNHIVVLMGDFNDDLNIYGGQINTMLRDCGLANAVNQVYGSDIQLPHTYNRGSKCLDLIAITDDISVPKHSIKSAGYLPFYHQFCSDHRLVFCDIDMSVLFGHVQPDLTRFLRRPFTTNNVDKCERFKTIVCELYTKSNIFEIIERLDKRFKTATKDNLDEVIKDCVKYGTVAGQLLLSAGRKVGHQSYSKGKPFSAELADAAQVYHDKRNQLKFLRVQQDKVKDEVAQKAIIIQIKDAYKELKSAQRNAVQIREAFLKRLAEKRANQW
jgi:hypothetical protein